MGDVSLTLEDEYAVLAMTGSGAFNPESLASFNHALDAALEFDETDLLLITGEGKNFSQGLDLDFIMQQKDPDLAMSFIGDCMKVIARLLTFPMPVVAMLNGHAFGLGAMIALASDYKVMCEGKGFFCLPEVDLGMTLTHRMNALVCGKLGGKAQRDLLLTGKRIGGIEAQQMNIVDAAVPEPKLKGTALELAAPMRGKQRASIAGLKRGINIQILAVLEDPSQESTIVD